MDTCDGPLQFGSRLSFCDLPLPLPMSLTLTPTDQTIVPCTPHHEDRFEHDATSHDRTATTPGHVLFITSMPDSQANLLRGLQHQGYEVTTAGSRREASRALLTPPYAVVLVDLATDAAPTDWWPSLRRLDAVAALPCIALLSPRDPRHVTYCEVVSAEDFLVSPFSIAELEARVELAQHRTPAAPRTEPSEHGLRMDLSRRVCYRDGCCVALTTREFDLLAYLFSRSRQTVSREELAAEVWSEENPIRPRTIDRHVTSIRKKIEEAPSAPVYLQTVYGKGYRFMPA